jgi:hypothetical protein
MFKRATGVILPPPVIYLLFLAAAWLLESVIPIALPQNIWTDYFGWGLIDAGVLLMLWAGLLMLWCKTTVNPYGKPARLLEEGPFVIRVILSTWPTALSTAVSRCSGVRSGRGCCFPL